MPVTTLKTFSASLTSYAHAQGWHGVKLPKQQRNMYTYLSFLFEPFMPHVAYMHYIVIILYKITCILKDNLLQ